jgi:NitT/TauT family transport system ATP-binding protein
MMGLRLEGLGLEYSTPEGPVSAFAGFDAELGPGSIGAIVGPSGSGKSSVIRVIAGLEKPSRGHVEIDGIGLDELQVAGTGSRRARTAVIFQDYGLLPWKTVEANVELPLLLSGMKAKERRRRSRPVLEELGLEDFARFYPGRLSGGMRQRVALGRAFAQAPDLLLMDEPFSSLDELTRETMQETLLETQSRRDTTVLIVTHSIDEAAYLADVVYIMRYHNPGRLAATLRAPGGIERSPAYREEPAFRDFANRIRRALEGREE